MQLHVRTCTLLFHISQTAGRIAFKFGVWRFAELAVCGICDWWRLRFAAVAWFAVCDLRGLRFAVCGVCGLRRLRFAAFAVCGV